MNSKRLKEVIDVLSYIPNLPGATHKVVDLFSVEKICNQVELDTREKCINAAIDAHCVLCHKRYGDFGCRNGNKYCSEREEIRKAIEEGGNNGND